MLTRFIALPHGPHRNRLILKLSRYSRDHTREKERERDGLKGKNRQKTSVIDKRKNANMQGWCEDKKMKRLLND